MDPEEVVVAEEPKKKRPGRKTRPELNATPTDDADTSADATERTKRLPPRASKLRKARQLVAESEEDAIREAAQNRKNHQRVRGIVMLVTGGGIEPLIRNSPQVSQDDKEFMRDQGWRL